MFKTSKELIVLTTLDSNKEKIKEILGEDLYFIYSTKDRVLGCLDYYNEKSWTNGKLDKIKEYIREGLITVDQGIIAIRYSSKEVEIDEVLRAMGLLQEVK